MLKQDLKYINKGVSQDKRLLPALLPENVTIDARTTVDLVSFLGRYSGLLNYYTAGGPAGELQQEGNWNFFTNDAVFRLAEIATTDISKKGHNINLSLNTLQDKEVSVADAVYALRLIFEVITYLLKLVNKWVQYMEVLPDEFAAQLTKIIQDNLSPLILNIRAYSLFYENHAHLSKYVYFDTGVLKSFDEKYWVNTDDKNGIREQKKKLEEATATQVPGTIIRNTYSGISDIAQTILYKTNVIIGLAGDSFTKLLSDKSNIKPDLGLLLAFLKLFEKAQHKMTLLTGNH